MNIAFFIPSLSNKGGVERATISLINSLATNFSFEVNIILITFSSNSFAFEISDNIKIVSLNIKNYKKQYLILLLRLWKAIRDNNINIVISVETMSLMFTFLPILALKNKPKLVVWEHFNYKNNNGLKVRSWLRGLASKQSDLIVTLTEKDAMTWVKNLQPKTQITYIYNISPFFNHKPKYDIYSKKAIAIGRYVSVKGFDRLIKAWDLFESKYGSNGWSLDIIGYGEEQERLQSIIDSTNSTTINLISDSQGIEQIYGQAAIYLMSSYFEGLPMVLIEAQSFALPSIAFDIYAGPSEILGIGSGILVKDNDLESYAEAIYKLTSNNNLRYQLSENSSLYNKRFSDIVIADEWIQKLKNL